MIVCGIDIVDQRPGTVAILKKEYVITNTFRRFLVGIQQLLYVQDVRV
jgi:hypothetical protein